MKTLADLSQEIGSQWPLCSEFRYLERMKNYNQVEFHDLENPHEFLKVFTWALETSSTRRILVHTTALLLKQPAAEEALNLEPKYAFYLAAAKGQASLAAFFACCERQELTRLCLEDNIICLTYLLGGVKACEPLMNLSLDETSLSARLEAFKWTTDYNYIDLFERLLVTPGLKNRATVSDNYALRMASKGGYLTLINHLLEIPTVVLIATIGKYGPFPEALGYRQYAVINRLLELRDIRRFYYTRMIHIERGILYKGVLRALWLDLQKTAVFSSIKNLDELQTFASAYLSQHPDWMSAPPSLNEKQELVESLKTQIIALAYYNRTFVASQFIPGLALNQYAYDATTLTLFNLVKLPISLDHFQEPSLTPSYYLAKRCLQHRLLERENQKPVSVEAEETRVSKRQVLK